MDNETIGDRLILMIQREWEAIENGNEPKSEIMDQAFEIARSLGVTDELADWAHADRELYILRMAMANHNRALMLWPQDCFPIADSRASIRLKIRTATVALNQALETLKQAINRAGEQ